MKEIMEVNYERTISEKIDSGERYICDGCGCLILDTTQIEDKPINNQDDEYIYKIECKIAGDRAEKHACCHICVKKIFNEWMEAFCEDHCPNSSSFHVNFTMLQTSHIMNRYNPTNMSNMQWNEIKQKSVPKKEKTKK